MFSLLRGIQSEFSHRTELYYQYLKNINVFIDVIIVSDCKTGKKVFHDNKFINVCVDIVRML